jgi:intracellular multiplication protein IcmJ
MNFERDLILSASREAWKMSSLHGTQSAAEYKRKHKDTWDKVWQRDKYRCYYCNFTAKEHQEIHHLNDNHDDNSMDNLVTVCPLCHQNFHLDTASNTNGGKIIWLPEFSQQELNYLCRAIFIAIDEASTAEAEQREVPGFTKIARNLETSLEERTMVVDQRIYGGSSDPAVFANALINMSKEQYDNRHKFLHPFKLLHLRSRFPTQTKYWKSKVFENVPVETWSRLILNNSNNNE